MSRASSKQSATRSERDHRGQPEGVLVEVHPGVQAPRLLVRRPVVASGPEHVERSCGLGEEPVGVEVRALHPLRLHDRVGAGRAQPQRPVVVPQLVGGLAVDHRPLVQPEAPGVGRSRRGGAQQVGQPPQQRHLRRDVRGRHRTRLVAAQPVVLRRVGEPDAVPGVPAAQLGRALGVVGEQEVVDRVLHPVGPAGQVGAQVRVDPGGVGLGAGAPGVPVQHLLPSRDPHAGQGRSPGATLGNRRREAR